jgi:hypothetical protein
VTSPLHRGNFFRSQVLCRPPIVFPGNIDTATPLEATGDKPTARERLAPLMTNAQCAGCHTQFNPIGFAFENFNAIGAWRDTENGALIDASGEIDIGTAGDPHVVSFGNAAELVTQLAASQTAHQCYALQWFRATTGRAETEEDGCSTAHLQYLVRKTNGNLRELMVALTQVDAFRYRRIAE